MAPCGFICEKVGRNSFRFIYEKASLLAVWLLIILLKYQYQTFAQFVERM